MPKSYKEPEYDPNNITIYVKKHKVVIRNGTLVYVNHDGCKKPCLASQEIISYLVAEAFVTASSVILAETYDNE